MTTQPFGTPGTPPSAQPYPPQAAGAPDPRVAQPPPPLPPPPPPPPSFRPSRNPIVRLFLWFTEPSMIKGIAVGIVIALIGGVALKMNAAWYIASGLMLVIVALVFGAVIGHYVFEYKRKKAQRQGLEMLRNAGGELPGLGDDLANVVLQRDLRYLPNVWERLRRLRPVAEEVVGLGLAAWFRMAALGALFAVLGSAISFAVFLTSYMQVERMTEGNELVRAQKLLTEEQMAWEKKRQEVEISLAIADRRQVTARELLTAIVNDPKLAGQGTERREVSASTALLIGASISQLQPYRVVDPQTNEVAPQVRSPEQEQILRNLALLRVDVSDLDLSRTFLDHAGLHNIELPGVQLQGVSMRHSTLYDSKLSAANLALADLTLAQLARADLAQANLTQAKLHGAALADAVLTEANLAQADLTNANLKGAVLKQAQLGSARLSGAVFDRCDLSTADLTEADLALADLSGLDKPLLVPKVRSGQFWWLGVYAPEYATKLGVSAEQLARNREALGRLRLAPDAAAAAAILQEVKTASPAAPG